MELPLRTALGKAVTAATLPIDVSVGRAQQLFTTGTAAVWIVQPCHSRVAASAG